MHQISFYHERWVSLRARECGREGRGNDLASRMRVPLGNRFTERERVQPRPPCHRSFPGHLHTALKQCSPGASSQAEVPTSTNLTSCQIDFPRSVKYSYWQFAGGSVKTAKPPNNEIAWHPHEDQGAPTGQKTILDFSQHRRWRIFSHLS